MLAANHRDYQRQLQPVPLHGTCYTEFPPSSTGRPALQHVVVSVLVGVLVGCSVWLAVGPMITPSPTNALLHPAAARGGAAPHLARPGARAARARPVLFGMESKQTNTATEDTPNAEELASLSPEDAVGAEPTPPAPSNDAANAYMEFSNGVLSESQLIDWPSLGDAVSRTILVLAITAAATGIVTGMNFVFQKASQQLFFS